MKAFGGVLQGARGAEKPSHPSGLLFLVAAERSEVSPGGLGWVSWHRGGRRSRVVSRDAEHSHGMGKVPSELQQTPSPQRRQHVGCSVRVCAEGEIASPTARTPRGSSSPGSGRLKLTVLSEDRLQMKWKETEGNINGYKVRVKPMAGMREHVGCQSQTIYLCIRD